MKGIPNFVYKNLLVDFINRVWELELTDEQQKLFDRGDERLWYFEGLGKDGENFFDKHFTSETKHIARNHFIRKKNEHPNDPEYPIKPAYLLLMLKYIGIEIPPDTPAHKLRERDDKTHVLTEEYKRQLVQKYGENLVYGLSGDQQSSKNINIDFRDVTNSDLPSSNELYKLINELVSSKVLQSKNAKNYRAEILRSIVEIAQSELRALGDYPEDSPLNVDKIKEVEGLVYDFYTFVKGKGFLADAWQLLSKELQSRRWQGKFANFEKGYKNIISIKDIHVWDVRFITELSAECKVFFYDKMHTRSHPLLEKHDRLKLNQFGEYVDSVHKLIELSGKTSVKRFKEVEIYRLFDPALSEYVWYNFCKTPQSIEKLFPIANDNLEIARISSVTCNKGRDQKWEITDISKIKTFR